MQLKRGFGQSPGKPEAASKKPIDIPPKINIEEQTAQQLLRQGKLSEAEAIYKALIKQDPRNQGLHSLLGNIQSMRGDHFSAKISYIKALEINPNSPEILCDLGDSLRRLGDSKAAKLSYKKAIRFDIENLRAHYNLGLISKAAGELNDALSSFTTVAKLKPDLAEAHISIGAILHEQGQTTVAIASLKKALSYQPNSAQALSNLGNSLCNLGDLEAAVNALQRAISIDPNYAEAHNNLGLALQKTGNLSAAISSFETALHLKKMFPEALSNLGLTLQEKGEIKNAISSFNAALQLNPYLVEVKSNLAMAQLLNGDYQQGLENYEFRFSTKTGLNALLNKPKFSQWDGRDLKSGQKLLLISEQGLGDTIHFMRYAIILRQRGLDVNLCAQPKLHSLIRASGIDSSPIPPEEITDSEDAHWLPLLSILRHLRVTADDPIISDPYIKAPDSLMMTWKEHLSSERRPIIGINWQGNPSHETTNSKGRSLPLETFAPIVQKTNASLLSLQKGFGSDQLETCSFRDRFVSCQDQINDTWDFLETAAIIANCDLVITSDTSVAHLAGGMGKTTWLLLKNVPEWRWGLKGDTTFWYPSMRLFRQKERGNWNKVMEQVAGAVHEYFGSCSTGGNSAEASSTAAKTQQIQEILAPISLGELIDKITILQIKIQHLEGHAQNNVMKELKGLESTLNNLQIDIDSTLIQRLQQVNQALWQIEDDIRYKEHNKDFGDAFVGLARSVYQQNDRRAAIKKEINTTYGSSLIEEKSYTNY